MCPMRPDGRVHNALLRADVARPLSHRINDTSMCTRCQGFNRTTTTGFQERAHHERALQPALHRSYDSVRCSGLSRIKGESTSGSRPAPQRTGLSTWCDARAPTVLKCAAGLIKRDGTNGTRSAPLI